MVSNINYYLYNLPNFYDQNAIALGQTLMRLVSGKKIQSPSDDVATYYRIQDLNNQYSQYQDIKQNLTEWQSAMEVASTSGGELYNKLLRMKDLSALYDSADSETQARYTAEYNQLKADVSTIISTTSWGSTSLLNSTTSLKKIDLVPDATDDTQRLDINPGEAITAAHLTALTPEAGEDIGDVSNHIQDAISDVQTFTAKVSGYLSALQSHINISSTIMTNTQSFNSLLANTNDAEEMLNYTSQSIRQQAALAMLSQGYLAQKSIIALYQFGR